ncbi:unnamed protein product [Peronospora destructor]|uniref:Uncharacterized protein n=1 Tax=Peronospora destructor TaxID=86335 RepID=A0AAV0UFE8_9STRA|nr:unnamed protein product [Peronospora destructor]
MARLELSSGAGIILWDEYWKVISVLLHTNDFELALSGKYDANVTKLERRPLRRSDSDLARELQAQFDAEDRAATAITTDGSPQLTKCRVTLDSSTEFIGKSVPMENVGTSGGHSSNPLEEIIKTKWPNARINWLVSSAPSID